MSSACSDINKGNLLRSYIELKSELEEFKLHCKIQIGCGHFLGNQKTLKLQMAQTANASDLQSDGVQIHFLTLIYFQETLEKSKMSIVKGFIMVFLYSMDRCYQRKYNLTLLADCFWFLKTEIPYMCGKKFSMH